MICCPRTLSLTLSALLLVAVSAPAQGTQTFSIDTGPDGAGLNYRMTGSATGTSPGIDFGGGLILPIVYDSYSSATIRHANQLADPEFVRTRITQP
jgi:hypothetical protein